jgi:hypothetical protein
MGKKILINERQLALLVNHIKENEKPIVIKEEQIIEEGWKELVLGAALVLGMNVGRAQDKAEKILQNDNLRNQIENTLNNEEGINNLAEKLRIDSDELKSYMEKNAQEINRTFDTYEKKNNTNISVRQSDKYGSTKSMLSKLKNQGYVITGIETIYDTIVKNPKQPVVMTDTISLSIPTAERQSTFSHDLPTETINSIQNFLQTIEATNGTIKSITILAKTDAERTPSYISDSDPTGNYTLAKKRAEEAKKAIEGSGIDFGGINIQIDATSQVNSGLKPGSEELKRAQEEFNTDRSGSRIKYSDDRGVDILIDYEYSSLGADDSEPEVIVDKIVKITYAKANLYSSKTKKIKPGSGKGNREKGSAKCKVNIGGSIRECPEF